MFSSCKATCPSSPAELGQGTWTTAGCLVIIYMGPGWNRTWATWLRSLRLSHCAMAALLFSDTVCLTCPSPCCQSCAGRRIALRQSCAGRRIALHQSCAGRRIALRQSCAGRRIAPPSILCWAQDCPPSILCWAQDCPPSILCWAQDCSQSRLASRLRISEVTQKDEWGRSSFSPRPSTPASKPRTLWCPWCRAPASSSGHQIGQNRGSDQPDPGAVSRRL